MRNIEALSECELPAQLLIEFGNLAGPGPNDGLPMCVLEFVVLDPDNPDHPPHSHKFLFTKEQIIETLNAVSLSVVQEVVGGQW